MDKLIVAKLVSKEFVVGRLIGNVITNPLQINFTASPDDGTVYPILKTLLSPLLYTMALTIPIDKTIVYAECPTELANKYVEAIQKSVTQETSNTENNNIPQTQKES